jgi:hypothetical protein
MTKRSQYYMSRRKALVTMCHPGSIQDLLIAEFNSSQNLIVKKDILKMIEQIENNQPATETNKARAGSQTYNSI